MYVCDIQKVLNPLEPDNEVVHANTVILIRYD